MYLFCFNFILYGHTCCANLILIDVQYSLEAVFSFEKGLNGQNHSSGFHHAVKNPCSKISDSPPSLSAIWTTFHYTLNFEHVHLCSCPSLQKVLLSKIQLMKLDFA